MSDNGRSEERGGGGDDEFINNHRGGGGGGGGGGGEQSRRGYKRKMRKAKHAVLFPFREVKRRLYRNKNNPSSSSSVPVAATESDLAGKSKRNSCTSSNSCCYLCYRIRKKPPLNITLDSSSSPAAMSHTSDPNHPSFSYELSKALIETNDFFSKECNVHIDLDHHHHHPTH